MSNKSFEVHALTPEIGAEIIGIDISRPLSASVINEIHRAFYEYKVIFFRDQNLDHDSQKAFARTFGKLHVHPTERAIEGHPEILRIHADENSRMVSGEHWHSDVSCDAEPPLGTVLYMHTVPATGGDTLFADMTAAFNALSENYKSFLAQLTAVHDGQHGFTTRFTKGNSQDERKSFPRNSHPVVRTHPVTKEKSLFVNPGFTTHIEGLSRSESDSVLSFLHEHCQKVEFQVRFKWKPNSVAFWDNRCTQHRAIWDYFPEKRSGFRVTVQGDRPA